MEGLNVHYASPQNTVGSYRNVAMWVWREQATPMILGEVRRSMLAVAKANPTGMGGVTMVHRDARIPDDEQRKQITRMRRDAAHAMKAGAIIYEGDGLRGALVRGVVTGLMLLAPEIYPHAVFRSAGEGVGFLRAKLGSLCPEALDLQRAMTTLRDTVG